MSDGDGLELLRSMAHKGCDSDYDDLLMAAGVDFGSFGGSVKSKKLGQQPNKAAAIEWHGSWSCGGDEVVTMAWWCSGFCWR
ncbi:hypothetical protein M0R45_017348 [Rubus argutus]|uniref:Uncharacterized protein n=1 Tax=Rubus argutus TaxID=59490 RepID=A0AAW1XVG9_RUBAR